MRGDETDIAGRVEACEGDTRLWMLANLIKLNVTKTEYFILYPQNLSDSVLHTAIPVGQTGILPCPASRNIGVVLDSGLFLGTHIIVECIRLHIRI